MKVSLLFTLLEVIKNKSTVVVLDEPEQGLDSESRLRVLVNVLNFLNTDIKTYNGGTTVTVLLIYHGDEKDIVNISHLLTKVWFFKKVDGATIVTENTNLAEYCDEIIHKGRAELDSLSRMISR